VTKAKKKTSKVDAEKNTSISKKKNKASVPSKKSKKIEASKKQVTKAKKKTSKVDAEKNTSITKKKNKASIPSKKAEKVKVSNNTSSSSQERNDTKIEIKKPKVQDEKITKQPPVSYDIGDHVVYPSHGVGKITAVEDHSIGDLLLKVFVVVFDKEKMTLRVPIDKTATSGMRQLSTQAKMDVAVNTLRGKARQRRVMWSRRAQEYEAKLNSGDPVAIAEVIRDLFRGEDQPDQSYSERQMYEAALERLAREYAALLNTDTEDATEQLEEVLKAA